jgi:hypothetical protein
MSYAGEKAFKIGGCPPAVEKTAAARRKPASAPT